MQLNKINSRVGGLRDSLESLGRLIDNEEELHKTFERVQKRLDEEGVCAHSDRKEQREPRSCVYDTVQQLMSCMIPTILIGYN